MGCGSSSLKGEKIVDSNTSVSEPSPQPIKKVRTNFSDIDYSATSQHRRNTEYAPTETERRPTTVPEERTMPGTNTDPMGTARAHDPTATLNETKLQPYKSNEEDGVTGHGFEPATTAFEFRNTISSTPAADLALADQAQTPRKKSLYDRYQAAKAGKTAPFTDDELKKYTGKTNAELNDWARTAHSVGPNQPAGSMTLPGSGLAAGEMWVDHSERRGITVGV